MSGNRAEVFGGVDTHRDVHVAAVVDTAGRILGTTPFPTDALGYEQMSEWFQSHGRLVRVGIEGTGSYGAGLSNRLCEGVSSYVNLGAVFGGWRWVQMRSEIRRLRTRIASLWVFPRVMSFW